MRPAMPTDRRLSTDQYPLSGTKLLNGQLNPNILPHAFRFS